MIPERSSIPDWLQTFLTIVGLVFICWFLLRLGVQEPMAVSPASPESAKPAACKSAVEQCTARAEVKLEAIPGEGCNPDKAKQRVESVLSDPLSTDGCKDTLARLGSGCPNGCELDNSQPLVVPGKLKFQSDARPNEAGLCSASGEVIVVLRAPCVRKSG